MQIIFNLTRFPGNWAKNVVKTRFFVLFETIFCVSVCHDRSLGHAPIFIKTVVTTDFVFASRRLWHWCQKREARLLPSCERDFSHLVADFSLLFSFIHGFFNQNDDLCRHRAPFDLAKLLKVFF